MDSKNEKNTHLTYISYLRIFATVCVIWLHTCSTLTDNCELFALTDIQNVFFGAAYQLMYWAVPVFFMITGALLLGRETSYSKCFYYVRRAMLALFVFGIPFAVTKLVAETGELSLSLIWKSIRNVIENQSFAHLWYLYILIGIYLVLPVLQNAVSRMKTADLKWILLILFVVDFVFPLIKNVCRLDIAFTVPFTYCLFYLLLGYYMNVRGGIQQSLAICGILASALIIIAANYTGFYPKALSSYNSPVIAVMALCVFSLFKDKIKKDCCESVWKIDRLCFGVYLVHPVFIQFTYRFVKITPVSFGMYYLAMIGFSFSFTMFAFIASWVMSKIAILKKYVL